MRATQLTSLVILWLLASESLAHANGRILKRPVRTAPAPAAQRAKAQPKPAEVIRSWTVDGWGETPADARQMALERARRELLASFDHALEWKPNLQYIDKNLVKDSTSLEDSEEPLKDWHGIRLAVEISRYELDAMLQNDRQLRSESRMLLLGKFLAGIVAFLGAVAGYLRLEEMTKGYYTAWLRLAAVGFVSAVGAGIWWVS
jgi:hypothetical protein